MADNRAWKDHKTVIDIAEGFQKYFDDFMALVARAGKFKLEVLGDSTRVAELKIGRAHV